MQLKSIALLSLIALTTGQTLHPNWASENGFETPTSPTTESKDLESHWTFNPTTFEELQAEYADRPVPSKSHLDDLKRKVEDKTKELEALTPTKTPPPTTGLLANMPLHLFDTLFSYNPFGDMETTLKIKKTFLSVRLEKLDAEINDHEKQHPQQT